jgi:inner membrane protein involved in colicin E2 resistance
LGNHKELIKKWCLRYIKYNIIGLSVFLLNIVLFVILFNSLGEWAYIVVSVNGGILEFVLISYVNRKKHGMIFESCSSAR